MWFPEEEESFGKRLEKSFQDYIFPKDEPDWRDYQPPPECSLKCCLVIPLILIILMILGCMGWQVILSLPQWIDWFLARI
jgi:hypothetical protein